MQTQGESDEKFVSRLSARMLQLGWSQADLAQALKIAQSTVNRWLHGARPQRRMREVLARTLGVSNAWLAGVSDQSPEFDAHLETIGRAAHRARREDNPAPQQEAFEKVLDHELAWQRRALRAERRLLQLRHKLLGLADEVFQQEPELPDAPSVTNSMDH